MNHASRLSLSAAPAVALTACVFACGIACGAPATQPADPPHAEARPERAPAEPSADVPTLPTPEAFARDHDSLASYWYQGKAELVRYRLEQSRYGEVRQGEAVLIFVTEPFLTAEQIKREHGQGEAVSALKLNHYRRFYTGIYPYTITTSTFLPLFANAEGDLGERLDAPALKVASSVQEWCGVAYAQLNRRETEVAGLVHSYFQDEGDQTRTLPNDALFEDALFLRTRRDPAALPTGRLSIVPAMHFLRMRHQPLDVYAADATLAESDAEGLRTYEVVYPDLGRRLVIVFRAAFPHTIERFEEHEGELPPTIATRTHAILDDYWSHNGTDHAGYREALGLSF